MRWLLIAVCALISLPVVADPALVGCTNGTSNAVNTVVVTRTTSVSNFLTLSTKTGSLSTTTWTTADSSGTNTWTQTPAGYVADDGANFRQDMRYVANAAAITSVTSTFSASPNSNSAILCEWSGMRPVTPLDISINSQGSGFISSLTSGTFSTTNAKDVLIYSVGMSGSVSAPVAGGSYTIPTNASNVGSRHSLQYLIVSATQTSQTASMSWTTTARATGSFAAFKAAGNCPACDMSGKLEEGPLLQ